MNKRAFCIADHPRQQKWRFLYFTMSLTNTEFPMFSRKTRFLQWSHPSGYNELHRICEISGYVEKGGGSMETILLQIPDDLIEEIRPHRRDLVQILRLGLGQLTTDKAGTPRGRTMRALQSTGLVRPIAPDLVSRYAAEPATHRRSPLQLSGTPLSEIVIEQRRFIDYGYTQRCRADN